METKIMEWTIYILLLSDLLPRFYFPTIFDDDDIAYWAGSSEMWNGMLTRCLQAAFSTLVHFAVFHLDV